jgi:hypothetical protein
MPASLITRRGALPNSCPGTGNRAKPPALPPEPAHSPSAYLDPTPVTVAACWRRLYAEGALSAVGAGEEVVRVDCFPRQPSTCQWTDIGDRTQHRVAIPSVFPALLAAHAETAELGN